MFKWKTSSFIVKFHFFLDLGNFKTKQISYKHICNRKCKQKVSDGDIFFSFYVTLPSTGHAFKLCLSFLHPVKLFGSGSFFPHWHFLGLCCSNHISGSLPWKLELITGSKQEVKSVWQHQWMTTFAALLLSLHNAPLLMATSSGLCLMSTCGSTLH